MAQSRVQYVAERSSAQAKYQVFPEGRYIINHRYKFIYCPIPKVACLRIKHAILNLNDKAVVEDVFISTIL